MLSLIKKHKNYINDLIPLNHIKGINNKKNKRKNPNGNVAAIIRQKTTELCNKNRLIRVT